MSERKKKNENRIVDGKEDRKGKGKKMGKKLKGDADWWEQKSEIRN